MALPKLSKLPKLGTMKGKMIKAKTAPSLKMGKLKTMVGSPKGAMRGYASGKANRRGMKGI